MTMGRRELMKAGLALAAIPAPGLPQSSPVTAGGLVLAPPGQGRSEGTGPLIFKVSGADTGGRYSLVESGPAAPLRHLHHFQDEWFYVVQGEFGLLVGDQKIRLAAGGSVLGPRGIPHSFVSLGPTPGKLLIMYEPAGTMEAYFREREQLRAGGRQPTVEESSALLRKHGCEYLGPPLVASSF